MFIFRTPFFSIDNGFAGTMASLGARLAWSESNLNSEKKKNKNKKLKMIISTENDNFSLTILLPVSMLIHSYRFKNHSVRKTLVENLEKSKLTEKNFLHNLWAPTNKKIYLLVRTTQRTKIHKYKR
jgi:hypothetical protein